MKKLVYIGVTIALLPPIVLAGLSKTAKVAELGLQNGRLRPCSETPNCVSSEVEALQGYVAPLPFDGTPDEAWARVRNAIAAIGGRVEQDTGDYLHATFRSRLFRFVDDLECRLDTEARVIHVRSASRIGYSDLGVNRKRIERLREHYLKV